jgi:hypothetical protein
MAISSGEEFKRLNTCNTSNKEWTGQETVGTQSMEITSIIPFLNSYRKGQKLIKEGIVERGANRQTTWKVELCRQQQKHDQQQDTASTVPGKKIDAVG